MGLRDPSGVNITGGEYVAAISGDTGSHPHPDTMMTDIVEVVSETFHPEARRPPALPSLGLNRGLSASALTHFQGWERHPFHIAHQRFPSQVSS